MLMDAEKCRVLLYAVDCGSMSQAAADLGYTVSGVSRMMAALEKEAGFPLLKRDRRGISATEECLRVMPAMREMVFWQDRVRQISGDICGLEEGTITVGTSYSSYYAWLVKRIAGFRKKYPGIEVRIIQGNSSELKKAVDEHRADLCIISRRGSGGRWIPLREDPMVAWVPSDHEAAKKETFPVKQFAAEPYIEMFPGEDTDNARTLKKAGVCPNTQFTTMDSGATFAMVEAGLGVSLNNSIVAEKFRGRVKMLPLDPPASVSIGMQIPDQGASPAAEKFIAYMMPAGKQADK